MTDQESNTVSSVPPPLVALAGWLIPGAGYWLIGQRTRGLVVLVTIVATYLLGLLIAGIRVIEVPGYDKNGMQIRVYSNAVVSPRDQLYERAGWIMTSGGFISEIAGKPWFVGQVLAGPLSLGSAAMSISLAQRGADFPRPHSPLENIGTLYCAIAGMLNLMVMIDSAYRAGQPREGE